MARIIVLDTFPLSSTGRREPLAGMDLTAGDLCRRWIDDCIAAGNRVAALAICYYEVMREMERLKASAQIRRIRTFCFSAPVEFLSINDAHLEAAAKLWAQARNARTPTADPQALDVDVILAAQARNLSASADEYVIATTNVGHLRQFAPAELWTDIAPGS